MSRNICPRCRRLVFQPEEKSAFGKVWHSFCFSCYICNRLLDCTNAQIAKEQLYCLDCFFKPGREDDDDQCPSGTVVYTQCQLATNSSVSSDCAALPNDLERCIRSISSRVRSTEDLKVKHNLSNIQSALKTSGCVYPCSIPVPHSISAWYNRQHRRRLLPTNKQLYCVPSCDSCASATANGRKTAQESECACPPSYSPVNQQSKPDTASEESAKGKRLVGFDCSKKEQRPKSPECCQSKVGETVSEQSEECCDASCVLKQKKAPSTTQNVNCRCDSFKPIATIKKALQQAATATSKPKDCHSKTEGGGMSVRKAKCGRYIPLGGGLDCRRCGRKVYFAEMFTVPGAVYHDTCFCCVDCRKPLEITTVYPTQGDIYCKLCYIRNFGPLGYGYGLGSGVLLSPNP